MTIQLEFSRDTLSILNDERYSHPMPIVQRRMEALWLKSHNLPHAQIAKLVGVCENTLRDYFKLYQEGGVENLRTVHFHRPQPLPRRVEKLLREPSVLEKSVTKSHLNWIMALKC